MCGRFVSYFDPADLAGVFDADSITDLPGPSWNVAPTNQVPLVRDMKRAAEDSTRDRADHQASEARRSREVRQPGEVHRPREAHQPREVRGARWGLVPSWAKDLSMGARLINARSETITVKPAFRAAAKSRRALIPAAGYYEWQAGPAGPKTPFFLHPEDEGLIALAALYEWWWPRPDRSLAPTGPASRPNPLVSATIVTRAATDALGAIHDRMPLVVPPELWEAWLSPELDAPSAVTVLIDEIPDPVLVPREVGRAVGSVRNDDPSLIAPAGRADGLSPD
ncbi:MAG: SOS response-associated peptidase family protein [Bifidobacteriaceae bacterium]|jgi:putative SOS response-associated peptidase YedK|nr:SOS response-associated peptidase family protein [Bifidobacteriaceae bacterium]